MNLNEDQMPNVATAKQYGLNPEPETEGELEASISAAGTSHPLPASAQYSIYEADQQTFPTSPSLVITPEGESPSSATGEEPEIALPEMNYNGPSMASPVQMTPVFDAASAASATTGQGDQHFQIKVESESDSEGLGLQSEREDPPLIDISAGLTTEADSQLYAVSSYSGLGAGSLQPIPVYEAEAMEDDPSLSGRSSSNLTQTRAVLGATPTPGMLRTFLDGTRQAHSVERLRGPESAEQAQFREDIRNGNYLKAIGAVVSRMSQLQIHTIIEDEDDPHYSGNLADFQGLAGQRMITCIDLLDGDLKNVIGSRFIEGDSYHSFREYHVSQVDKGLGIISQNISALQQAIKNLQSWVKDES